MAQTARESGRGLKLLEANPWSMMVNAMVSDG